MDLQEEKIITTESPEGELPGTKGLNGRRLETKTLRRWARKGGLAVLDQGLFSGANFLVNILLARWLPPEEYGAFAVALSIFYLLAGFHTAVLTEPMMVFGAGKYREHFRKYLGMLLWGHWAISALIALILGVAAFVMARLGSAPMAQALAGLAIASPFLLLLWLTRRAPYVEMRPGWAVVGSGVNLVVTLGGIFLLWRLGLLSSLSGLVLLGAAGAVASLAISLRIKPQVAGYTGNPTPKMVVQGHWQYGRWSAATVLLMWVPGNIYYSLLPATIGLEGSAALRAIHNLILPVLHALSAVSILVMSYFSNLVHSRDPRFFRTVLRVLLLFILCAAGYALLLLVFGVPIMELLYKGNYTSYAPLLYIAAFLPVSVSVVSVVGGALRAMEKPQLVFYSYVATFVSALGVGIPLMFVWGVKGALIGQLVSSLTTAGAMTAYYLKIALRA